VPPERVGDTVTELRGRVRELERQVKQGGGGNGAVDVDALLRGAREVAGASVLTATVTGVDGKALLELADKLKGKLGDAVIVLASATDGKVDLIVSVAPALVTRGVRAGEIVKTAAAVVGGGGGGRDTLARAGGRNPTKLPEAIDAARSAIEAALGG
jgi:alanyl-tRNA synthetase